MSDTPLTDRIVELFFSAPGQTFQERDAYLNLARQFERTIATLTAERDAANTEIARLIQANEHWHVRVTQLKNENDFLQAELDQYPPLEYVAALAGKVDTLRAKLEATEKDLDIQIERTTKCRENSVAAINELQAAKAAIQDKLEAAERALAKLCGIKEGT